MTAPLDAAPIARHPYSMEILRHPLYSILAVVLIGAVCGAIARAARPGSAAGWSMAVLAGIGAAFLGFHTAMLSNLATGVILMPFAVSMVVALALSFALRHGPR